MGHTESASHRDMPFAHRDTSAVSRFERNRDKALALFASKGFGQVSLRELASHLGLATGSLYHHCSSKEELLFMFIEEHYEELLAVTSRGIAHRASPGYLGWLATALIELHREQPLRFRLATKERQCLTPAHQQRIDELQLRCQELWLREVGFAAELPPSHRKAAGEALSNIFQQIPTWLEHSALPDAERAALLESLMLGAVSQLIRCLQPSSSLPQQGNPHAQLLRSAP